MSTEDSLKSKFSDATLTFSQFRDNHRVEVPAARLYDIP